MIYQLTGAEGAPRAIVIQPSRSMSWRGLLLVYTGIATVTLGVGLACWVIGLPLVLPFSGVELLVLGAAFYLTARSGGVREVVSISAEQVAVEAGRTGPERRAAFQRHWTRVILEPSGHGWYPSRLLIRSHGREVELGKFLNEQERCGLAVELRAALQPGQRAG